ncbi:ribosome-associated translation inhibitor RaiA [Lujinxingia vulgaris]|uniref:Ribosome-associated translation inhibitor RaiA n=1 Tax=Lujinxingia vulgaris TaxID=2600176 RepID=A0A5C6XBS3_9DELT|nr:ribosome-associated translation inhibitor RaiA [Lujinxingia vulgaris]TXD37167.1 ribosome-associated translation inhibitor RaiA [Lujinxingia vulgaris]
MNANVSFRNMDSSASLRNYATAKLERICDKYVQGKIDASVVMTVEKFWHIADFTLQIKNLTVKGAERSEDMYSSIDLALDKIEKQLRRHKDRLRDHKPTNGQAKMFKMAVVSPIAAESAAEIDSEFAEDYELYPEPSAAEETPVVETVNTPSGRVSVLRNKLYEAKPMSIDEAVLQLDLLEDRQFFVFTNAETQAINVVYKRDDKNVGVIET